MFFVEVPDNPQLNTKVHLIYTWKDSSRMTYIVFGLDFENKTVKTKIGGWNSCNDHVLRLFCSVEKEMISYGFFC